MRLTRVRREQRPLHTAGALLATALSALMLVLGFGASPALAHADLLGTVPEDGAVLDEAPSMIELNYNEPVQLIDEAMRLYTSDGTQTVLNATTHNTAVHVELPESLPEGAYTLSYRIVSADGHPVGGVLSFQVGDGDFAEPEITASQAEATSTEIIVSILTGLQYFGLLTLAGIIMFGAFIAPNRASSAGRSAPATASPQMRRLALGATVTAAIASLALIPASGARVAGKAFASYVPGSGSIDFLSSNEWLPSVTWPVVATAAAAVGFGLIACFAARAQGRAARVTALVAAGLALASPVLVGHTQTVQPIAAMIVADLGHLAAGAFWLGGVLGLLLVFAELRRVRTSTDPTASVAGAIDTVERFSRLAPWSVAVLALSGGLMGVLILGSVKALFTTGYGLLLIAKLALLLIVVAVAAYNRFSLLPRIARHDEPERRAQQLRSALRIEAVVLIAILAVTGFLTNSSPNESTPSGGESAPTASEPQRFETESQGLTVRGEISPGRSGENELTFALEYEGEEVTVEEVTVEARLPAEDLGPLTATATRDEQAGDYAATLSLPLDGEWKVQLIVRIDTYTQPIAVVPVTIGG